MVGRSGAKRHRDALVSGPRQLMEGKVEDPAETRRAIADYLREHDVERIVSRAVNDLVRQRPGDPCAALAGAIAAHSANHTIEEICATPCFTELGRGVRIELRTGRATFATTCVRCVHVRRAAPHFRSSIVADAHFVEEACTAVATLVAPALKRTEVTRQDLVDGKLRGLTAAPAVPSEDGSARTTRRRVPAEVAFAVSRLCCVAGAAHLGRTVVEHMRQLAGIGGQRLPPAPVPIVPLVAGGAGTVSTLPWEAVCVAPIGAASVRDALDFAALCEAKTAEALATASEGAAPLARALHRGGAPDVPAVESPEGALALAVRAVDEAELDAAARPPAGGAAPEGASAAGDAPSGAALRGVVVACAGMDACDLSVLPPVDGEEPAAGGTADAAPGYLPDFKADSGDPVSGDALAEAATPTLEAVPLLRVLVSAAADRDVPALHSLCEATRQHGTILVGDAAGTAFGAAAARAEAAARARRAAADASGDGKSPEDWDAAEAKEAAEEEERARERAAARRKAEEEEEEEARRRAEEDAQEKGKGKGKGKAAPPEEKQQAADGAGEGEEEAAAVEMDAAAAEDPRNACGTVVRVRASAHGTVSAAAAACKAALLNKIPLLVGAADDACVSSSDSDGAFDVHLAAAFGAAFVDIGSLLTAAGRRRAEALVDAEDAVAKEKEALAGVLQGRYAGRAGHDDASRPTFAGRPLLESLGWGAELSEFASQRAERVATPFALGGGAADKGKAKKKK